VSAAAVALAAAIQSSPEWTTWKKAQAAFEQDSEVGVLIRQYRGLVQRWKEVSASGQELNDTETEQWLATQEALKKNPLVVQREEATTAMLDMLRNVNGDISEAIGLDFAASAAKNCGGGCCG